jgi:uncharacterized protein YndB with AHSA1/START domain
MTTMEETRVETTQIHRVYIMASAQAVWDAITKPEWTERYGYSFLADYDLRPGGAFVARPSEAMIEGGKQYGIPVPDVIGDGEVIEADPPRKLVQTWRLLMDPEMTREGFTRLTYEIEEIRGATKLTVIHELAGAPKLALLVSGNSGASETEGGGGGWPWVLSDLKSLLETGSTFSQSEA